MNFIIKGEVYPFGVMVSFGETDEQLRKQLLKYFPEDYVKTDIWKYSHDTAVGSSVKFDGNQSLIRLRSIPKTPYEMACLMHECLHITQFVMEGIGMKLKIGVSDEAYCYYHAWLIEQILIKIK